LNRYLHQLPGLVHFILVDRLSNRVTAPTIAPLHGQQFTPHEETRKHMVNLLKQKVWDMCYQGQKHLAQGYCSMLIKAGDFQYSYRLWIEDIEGNDLPLPLEQNAPSYLPLNNTYYQELVKKNKNRSEML